MAADAMDITILCKVVDNYGDIGFVYRLARALAERLPAECLRLVVSNLDAFAAMAPGVQPGQPRQQFRGWTVLDWNADAACREEYARRPPQVVLECFQCGRPGWLDGILFEKGRGLPACIINVEYLTAESWAEDFHLLKSGTRSARVKKYNFMPGFTARTGGLVADAPFSACLNDRRRARAVLAEALAGSGCADAVLAAVDAPRSLAVPVFGYPRDFGAVARALARFQRERRQEEPDFSVCVLAASGLSLPPLRKAWLAAGQPFALVPLPYLAQEAWDALLALAGFAFVRGEDSFARACLCGVPFIWHAYPQAEEFQLVKVAAVLERLRPFFADGAGAEGTGGGTPGSGTEYFSALHSFMLRYNMAPGIPPGAEARDALAAAGIPPEAPPDARLEEDLLLTLLRGIPRAAPRYRRFSRALLANGNLADHLLAFLRTAASVPPGAS